MIPGGELLAVKLVKCKNAVSPSKLPGLDWAVNPYRGCEHGCAYCYVQDLTRFSLGSTWGETVEVKANFAKQLKKELGKRVSGVYGIGTVTDPYQPAEARYELTRNCLQILKRFGASVSILTKSDLVLRDLDILSSWAGAEVGISLACVDEGVSSILEPRAPAPIRRLGALSKLVDAGIDTYLMAAPIVPELSDSEKMIHQLVDQVASVGVKKIMWDRYNPRPFADARMVSRFPHIEISDLHSPRDPFGFKMRCAMEYACSERGIVLLDAF
ncbi:MAG: radical SAM protein [Candidatus Thermoplasmatota archaeon]|nr:radical SAM protein [Candidatus Thermoplasmatota archaeon]